MLHRALILSCLTRCLVPRVTPTRPSPDVLYFLVGSDEEGRSIPPARVVKFMEESGLMRPVRGGGALRITDKG